jgi:FAD/FMN-containing dehydrogenase
MTMSIDPLLEPDGVAQRTRVVVAALPALEWITDDRVARLSQDFNWYSPVLKRQLAPLRADAVARPKTEDEIAAVVGACAREQVPITVRGSGTGNYGQCVPLHGGVILDLSAYNRLLWVRPGVGRAQAGIRLGDMDRQMRQAAQELRCVPSTWRSATLGGLFGGGFGGLGSINYGPLAARGNVLGVRALSVEPEPRAIELRAPEALLLHHVYGCNGIVLEIEAGLGPAHPWLEAIVSFDAFEPALAFADALAAAPGIVKKGVTLLAQPIPDLLLKAVPALGGHLQPASHAALVLVAEFAEDALQQLVRQHGGRVTLRRSAAEVVQTQRTITEYTWNHTTLHAMKADKSLTYTQCAFQAGRHTEQAAQMREQLGDEVHTHLEWIRNLDGALTCSGLQLIRYSGDERLNAIQQTYRDHGVSIANPHVFIVEDGKQGRINPDVVAMKQRLDPLGLLNPGKLRGWAVRDQLVLPARAQPELATLPRF